MQGRIGVIGVLVLLAGLDLYNVWKGRDEAATVSKATQERFELYNGSVGKADVAYRGTFVQVEAFVQQNFPGTEVLGTSYPVPPVKVMLGRVVTFGQIGIAAVMLAGDQIFQALAMPPPPLYLQLREKKTGVLMGTWIVGNMIQNSLSATGAFEVYSNGELIFSKLQSNRLPTAEELLDGLTRTLQPGT